MTIRTALLALVMFGNPASAQSGCDVPGSFSSIAAALANPSCGIIELTAPAYHEAVVIERNVELRGYGASRTTLYGTGDDGQAFGTSVVTVIHGAVVTLSDLTIRDGKAPNGGGITNDGGQLTLLRCRVENNEATDVIGEGGGILNRAGGGLVLIETTVRRNKARLNGGGIGSSGLSVPILSDPSTRQNLANAYAKLRSIRIPNYSPFPTPDSLVALGEGFLAISKEVVDAVGDLMGKGLGNLLDGAAPANRTRTSLLETGFTALAIADSVIEDNTVDTGTASAWGGGIHADQGFVLIENTRISGNKVQARIGAFGGGVSAGLSFVLIRNSQVTGNEAKSQTVVSGGGAVWNLAGALEVHDSRLDDNSATSFFLNNGGAIHNMGGLARVFRSTLERNQSGNGGGITNHYMGDLTVEDCSIRGNQVDGIISAFGGGINNEKGGTVTIRRSAITGNTIKGRSRGGGIYNESEAQILEKEIGGQTVLLPLWNTTRVTIENSTISGNVIDGRKEIPKPFAMGDCQKELNTNLSLFPSLWQQAHTRYEDCKKNGFGETFTLHLPSRGAGIYTGAQGLGLAYTTLRNSTVAFNESLGNEAHGGGLYSSLASGLNVLSAGLITDVSVESSLVTNNQPSDCAQFLFNSPLNFSATRANLDTDGTCRAMDADFSTSDPQLLPLGRYGGLTMTHAFPGGSPAKDQTNGCPATDQRGEHRSLGGVCDIGAFELTPPRGVPDSYSGHEDEPIVVSGAAGILANDMGLGLAQAQVVTQPQHGSVLLQPNGEFVYTPERDYFGSDSFTYGATDLSGTSIGPIQVAIEIAGRLDVIAISPAPEAMEAARVPEMTIDFDDPMTLAGVTGRVFLYGNRSKPFPRLAVPAANLAVSGNRLTITSPSQFAPGERITLVLSDRVTSGLDIRLSKPLLTEMVVQTEGGGGGFAPATFGSFIGHKVVLGDLDGDGDLDAVISSEFTQVHTSVWIHTGGGFTPGQGLTFQDRNQNTRPFRASGLALADLDGDGDLDLIATTNATDQFTTLGREGIHTRLWFNNGNGTFTVSSEEFLSGTYPDPSSPILIDSSTGQNRPLWINTAAHRAVALGDLDGDGDIDAYIVAGVGRRASNGTGTGDAVRWDSVWLNDGGGHFTRGATVGFDYGEAVALGDADGDGDLDAFVANSPGPSRLWTNDGSGHFNPGASFPGASDVKVGDFNGDGKLDVAFAPTLTDAVVWLGDGTGQFTEAANQPAGIRGRSLDVGDLDGDGDLDLFLNRGLHYEYFQIRGIRDQVWINGGNANFSLSRQVFPETLSAAVALGDIDKNGILDALVLNIGFEILEQDGKEYRRATPDPATVWYGLPPPRTSPDTYTIAEDSVLTRHPVIGVLANDAAPGAQAKHPWRIDTYTTATGTLGRLWIELYDLGIPFSEVDFDWAEGTGWFATHRVVLGQPAHGTVSLAADGGFTYTPAPDFFGTDTFTYFAAAPAADSTPPETVTIHVTPVNDPPTAVDDGYDFQAGGVVVDAAHGVLKNDSDVDGDMLTAVLSAQALRGTVTLNPNGSFSYVPGPTQTGGDVFFYRARDPSNAQSAPARVKLGNSTPTGQTPSVYTPNPDGSLSVAPGSGLLTGAGDPDNDTLIAILTVPPRHGTVVVQPNGSFVYTPGPDWRGSDVFFYVVSDGTASSPPIRVKIGNAAPVARNDRYVTGRNAPLNITAPGVMANDTDADGDSLSATLIDPATNGTVDFDGNGSFTFTPAPNFLGEATFTYTVSDGLVSAQATVTVGVFDELRILSQTPQANAVGVAHDRDVSIEFDQNVAASTTTGRVRITGAQRGRYDAGLSTANRVVTAQPTLDFFPGERITVSALAGIEGAGGSRLMRTHHWRLDAVTAVASGQLEDSGQALGSTAANAVVLGDVDGDRDLDAFVASSLTGNAKLWLNDGNGGFHEDTTQDLQWANDLALGDLDGDGDLDLFVASISHGTIPVLNHAGHFDWPAFIEVGDSLVQGGKLVELADLDGDGDLDAVIATTEAFSVVVALNDGSGHFTAASQLEAGNVRGMTLGDLDGDGAFDLIAGTDQGVRAWRGDGNGAFSVPLAVQTDETSFLLTNSVDLGDLDGDGDLDVLAGGFFRRIYLNDGNGRLTERLPAYPGPASQVVLGDFDGDGDLDFFVATGRKQSEGIRPHEVWLNDGTGEFTAAPRAPVHDDRGVAVALGDLDGDGDLDAFIGTHDGAFTPKPARVLFNRTTPTTTASGRFVDSTQRLGNKASTRSYLVDLDGDGDLDAYVVNDYESLVTPAAGELWLNDGVGNLSLATNMPAAQISVDVAFGDLDGDSYPDMLLVGAPSRVYRNDGNGKLVVHGPALDDTLGGVVRLADLDGDGDLDAVQLRRQQNDIFTIWRNNGTGTFALSATLTRPPKVADPASFPATVWDVAIFDADADGDLDLYATTSTAEHTLWRNDGNGNFPVTAAQTYPGGFRGRVSAGDIDGDGDIDLLLASISTAAMIRSNDGDGTFSNGPTFNARTAGNFSTLADVNADGHLDAVFGRNHEPAEFWINNGLGSFTHEEGVIGTGETFAIAFGDLDGDGDLDAFVAQGRAGLTPVFEPNEMWLNTTLNPMLAITGTAPLLTGDDSTASPFAQVHVTAPAGKLVSLRIEAGTLEPGSLSADSVAAAGFVAETEGVWTLVGVTPGVAIAALRALRFEPIENRVPVGMQEIVPLRLRASTDEDVVVDEATVVTIVSINDPPVGGPPQALTVAEGGWFEVTAPGLLAGAFDPDVGESLAVELLAAPAAGDFGVQPNGALIFVARGAAPGMASFSYAITDGRTSSLPVVSTITITGVNKPPFGLSDEYVAQEDTPLVIGAPGVLGNDGDPDGDPVQAVFVNAVYGEVVLSPNGSFLYTPPENFSGTDTFFYTVFDGVQMSAAVAVTIHVQPVNDAPVAVPDSYRTQADTPLEVPARGVLTNDLDADGDELHAILVQAPARGTLTFGQDGSIFYIPEKGYHGAEPFTYRVGDGTALSEPVTVTILVGREEGQVLGEVDIYFVERDQVLEVPAPGVLGNDHDPDGGALEAVEFSSPSQGSLELRPDGSFTFTPGDGFVGGDLFFYTSRSSARSSDPVAVIVVVERPNSAPGAMPDAYETQRDTVLVVPAPGVLGNDTDAESDGLAAELLSSPAHGTLSLNPDGGVTYTPAAGYSGLDSFTYRAFDGKKYSQPATVSLAVVACGDGNLHGSEQCDDGNRDDGDGCTAACLLEPEKTVAGSGVAATNCAHHWLVQPRPERGARVRCRDGDPTCDAGPAGDGRCQFRVASCFNVGDANGTCRSQEVRDLRILLPRVKSSSTTDGSNRAALEAVLMGLGAESKGVCLRGPQRSQTCTSDADCDSAAGRGGGRCELKAAFEPPLGHTNQCTASGLIEVPTRSHGERTTRGLQRLRVQAVSTDSSGRVRRDLDTLTLICEP